MSKEIIKIIETNRIKEFLLKRRLLAQYIRKKENILNNIFSGNNLKLREPKKDEVWYFRINKQYRALCYLDDKTLKIFDIDNHQ